MSWEQESGDDLPTIYHHLAANRRILEAHEAEQDRLEALPCPHARASWRHCPHCTGLNSLPYVPGEWTITRTPLPVP